MISQNRVYLIWCVSIPDPILQYVCSVGSFFLPQTVINLSLRSFLILSIYHSLFVLPRSHLVLAERFTPISQAVPRYSGVHSGGLYLSSLSSLDRNRAHRHPTRKGAPPCNAEMGSEVGSHVYSIEERSEMSGLYTKAMPKSNLPLQKEVKTRNKPSKAAFEKIVSLHVTLNGYERRTLLLEVKLLKSKISNSTKHILMENTQYELFNT